MPWLIAAVLLLLLEMVIPKRPKRRSRAALTTLAVTMLGPQVLLAQSDTKAKMVEGTEAFRANQFEDAATQFGEAAMDEQATATALYNQGCALLSSGDAESASAAFERALTQTEDATFRAQAHYLSLIHI